MRYAQARTPLPPGHVYVPLYCCPDPKQRYCTASSTRVRGGTGISSATRWARWPRPATAGALASACYLATSAVLSHTPHMREGGRARKEESKDGFAGGSAAVHTDRTPTVGPSPIYNFVKRTTSMRAAALRQRRGAKWNIASPVGEFCTGHHRQRAAAADCAG
jgi:hypothetical protein